MLPEPYYDRDGITIYRADCRDILPHLPPYAANLGVSDSQRCAYCLKIRHVSVMREYLGRWFCIHKCWRHRLTTPRGR